MGCQNVVIENCDSCYTINIAECNPLTFYVGLSGTYNLNVLDKFRKLYTESINVSGSFTIDQSLFPPGYFNKYAGNFEIYLTNGSGFTVPLTISGNSYNCILLTII